MGFQIVLPGETAAAHRHANTALRFVVSGGGASTTSNGEPMVMEPGDLLSPDQETAFLFSVSDRPLLKATGLDRQEAE